ncbi:hypothetical protein BDV97DRAFT_369427 [Delphinella strobiligena]|nr:hypothetical protein BDV97DRAFT_369427 [Delphinella strobiligena]
MDTTDTRITDQPISRQVYFLRRAAYLDKVVPPGHLQQTHASTHAAKVYEGVNSDLSIAKMNELETAAQVQTTSASDFRGGFNSGGAYSRIEYQETRARSLQRGVNSEQVVRDADVVFGGEGRLRALEILEREIAGGRAPLLPLPTTGNLQTVDDSLGDGDVLPLSVLSTFRLSEEQRQQVLRGAPPATDSRAPSFSPVTAPSSVASPSPARAASPAPPVSSPGPQRTVKGSKSRGKIGSAEPYPVIGPAPKTRASRYNKSEQKKEEDMKEIEEDLEQVSSVKTRTYKTRALRHSIPEEEEANEEGEGEKKKKKEEEKKEEEEEVLNALPQIPRKIRDILLGKVLPTNAKEAEEGATARRECLIRHKTAISGHKINARGLNKTAMPPEFATPSRKAHSIACVCGNKNEEDVEGEWVACDQCNVWQHVDCMGDGVPEEKEKGEYLCQQCDPFTHRKLIRRLRREQPLPDVFVPRGV